MSLLGKLFGGKKKDEGEDPQTAIQRLRDTEELLNKKSEFLEKKIDEELKAAKTHGTKNKRAAIQALKRKKRYEKQLGQIDGTLSTIELQREALENASTNTEVLKAMHTASKSLKKAHQDLDVDKIADLMDDIQEQQDIANEISDAISNPVGMAADFDEDDLLAELDELEQEELDKHLLEVPTDVTTPMVDDLPSVPSTTVPSKKVSPAKKVADAEDSELAELAEWAS